MTPQPTPPTFNSYLTGFILSVFFTIMAFVLVLEHLLTGNALVAGLLLFAVAQAWIQLIFFLHLGSSSRWNSAIFLATISLVLVVVIGSLWIMHHLNYNMTPQQMDDYMMKSEGIH